MSMAWCWAGHMMVLNSEMVESPVVVYYCINTFVKILWPLLEQNIL
jgi:hypothetical protein